MVAGAWTEASRRFAQEFQEAALAGKVLSQPKDALKLWLDVANRTLLETHRSERFLAAQAELLRHGMDFLLAEREMVEALVEPAGLPTRTEIDEVHRSVHELKRRVRALEKAAAAAAGDGPQAQGAPAGSPAMIPMPTAGTAELMREAAAFNTKVAAAVEKLGKVKDEDVQIATTPKDEVFRTDKVTLYRYRPLAEPKIQTPVLIVYSLIGRYTMTDLQEDRSLIRNLLKQGVDVWVVDWGNSSRADRYLTIDDYVLGYLDDCVEAMRGATGAEAVDLLGICEGGVLTLAYAALEPARVKNLILTVTPLDFHADQREEKLEHGFINVWTRSLTAEDVDRMIEVWGVLPGEFMGAVFSMLTPIRSITKYNLDLLEVVDDEAKLLNYLRMEKWLADRPHHAGRGRQAVAEGPLPGEQADHGTSSSSAGGEVDLREVTMPVLNIYAQDDHIIPPPTVRVLGGKLGTEDYTELGLPGGHIGVFVSGKSQGIVGKGIVDWLGQRDR